MTKQHPRRLELCRIDQVSYIFPQHCTERDYVEYLEIKSIRADVRKLHLEYRRDFIDQWPNLELWFAAPMIERAIRTSGKIRRDRNRLNSARFRPYIFYLALTNRIRLDHAWMFAAGQLRVEKWAAALGEDFGTPRLVAEAMRLGYVRLSALHALRWSVTRIALQSGVHNPEHLNATHIDGMFAAIEEFGNRPDVSLFYGSADRFKRGPAVIWTANLMVLKSVLFHRGQCQDPPKKGMRLRLGPVAQTDMWMLVERWLEQKKPTLQPKTVADLSYSMRIFVAHLNYVAPAICQFDQVTREHALSFVEDLAVQSRPLTGRPMSACARRSRILAVAQFFRDTANWGWEGVPRRQLLDCSDAPRMPLRVPRFIPAGELAKLMDAIRALDCPYQRAALLVARWSGARRREIYRLPTDCLDAYPDGTSRLRIPAGKTWRERMVPLQQEAAEAVRVLLLLRAGAQERPLLDVRTGSAVYFLFSKYGRQLSVQYLFGCSLDKACRSAGLVDGRGRATVTAHRFRHTVGTELAEGGASLHTIMTVLGHESSTMSMTYSRISDPEVLRDYKAVLGPGAIIAGPGADAVRGGILSKAAVNWLQTNFLKTELELGHCLRLPAEGPCECDLFFTCSRFVTTPAYAARLRERHKLELDLAGDAQERGWTRELERHRCIGTRIEKLLMDMGLDPACSTEASQDWKGPRPASAAPAARAQRNHARDL